MEPLENNKHIKTIPTYLVISTVFPQFIYFFFKSISFEKENTNSHSQNRIRFHFKCRAVGCHVSYSLCSITYPLLEKAVLSHFNLSLFTGVFYSYRATVGHPRSSIETLPSNC